MKKLIVATLIAGCALFHPTRLLAQDAKMEKTEDLLGKHTKPELQKVPFSVWFTPGFEGYKSDPATIAALKPLSKDIEITIFMGTWCEDSQNQVPHFYKILSDIGFDEKKVTLITVDRNKKTPEKWEEGKNITNVPTFIFYKNGKELHRIVETPIESLEKDMFKILSGKPYLHTYEK